MIESKDRRQKVVNVEILKRAAFDFSAEISSDDETDDGDTREPVSNVK